MNRIDQLLQQMIAETSQQVLPTVYSATMLAGLQELQGLTGAIAEQRAFAQQPAPAVPEGWRDVIENARESIGSGTYQENASTERRYVEPYLDGIYDELEKLEKSAAQEGKSHD